jgi:cysteine desulfurase
MNYSSTETSHKSAYNLINTNIKGLSLFSIETINHETGRYNVVSNQPEKAFYHADNVQGFLKMNMPLHMYDAITLSSHKIYGPKGIGCLWVSDKLLDHFSNIDFYNGTLSPVLIRGFAKAIEVYDKTPKPYVNEFLSSLQLNYISFGYNIESQNLSYISSISFPEVKAVDLLMELNARGVYASQGSACNKGKFDTRILRSSGYSQDDWNSTVRFSFGKLNENTDFRELAKIIKDSINAAKN